MEADRTHRGAEAADLSEEAGASRDCARSLARPASFPSNAPHYGKTHCAPPGSCWQTFGMHRRILFVATEPAAQKPSVISPSCPALHPKAFRELCPFRSEED